MSFNRRGGNLFAFQFAKDIFSLASRVEILWIKMKSTKSER